MVGIGLNFKIKQARKASKKTQQEVAEALGVSIQAVSQWENGRTDPSAVNLIELQKVIGLDLDEKLSVFASTKLSERERPVLAAPLVEWDTSQSWMIFRGEGSEREFSDTSRDAEEVFEVKWRPVGQVFALRVRGKLLADFRRNDIIIIDTQRSPEPGDYVVALPDDFASAFLAVYEPRGTDQHRAPIYNLRREDGLDDVLISGEKPGRILGTVREVRRYFRTETSS